MQLQDAVKEGLRNCRRNLLIAINVDRKWAAAEAGPPCTGARCLKHRWGLHSCESCRNNYVL